MITDEQIQQMQKVYDIYERNEKQVSQMWDDFFKSARGKYMITEYQVNQMMDEYNKGGKFKEFLDKACASSGLSPREEARKIIVFEYFKSVVDGCNKEKQSI